MMGAKITMNKIMFPVLTVYSTLGKRSNNKVINFMLEITIEAYRRTISQIKKYC